MNWALSSGMPNRSCHLFKALTGNLLAPHRMTARTAMPNNAKIANIIKKNIGSLSFWLSAANTQNAAPNAAIETMAIAGDRRLLRRGSGVLGCQNQLLLSVSQKKPKTTR